VTAVLPVEAARGRGAVGDATVLASCLYVGTVRHRRLTGVRHEFKLSLYLAYLDLDEIEQAFAGGLWWSATHPAPMRWLRRDYFGPADRPLGDCVRDAVQQSIGVRPDGPVRMLTNLRCFGFVFNPVTFYYCFDRQQRLVAVLAEITNTPWRQRHHYVVAANGAAGTLRATFPKAFHVSPFQPMEQSYVWAFSPPGDKLAVHMENHAGDAVVFDATLAVERRPWTARERAKAWCRHPLMALGAILLIYWHALRLWWKRAPFHPHPKHRGSR
jgi:DUF1365 family protein